jgi:hypothetical protein
MPTPPAQHKSATGIGTRISTQSSQRGILRVDFIKFGPMVDDAGWLAGPSLRGEAPGQVGHRFASTCPGLTQAYFILLNFFDRPSGSVSI